MDALLLVVHSCTAVGYTDRGDFHMDGLGRLSPRPERVITSYVYGGIQILKPTLVDDIGDDVFSLRRVWWDLAEKQRLFGVVHEGLWGHVGTPEARGMVERRLLE